MSAVCLGLHGCWVRLESSGGRRQKRLEESSTETFSLERIQSEKLSIPEDSEVRWGGTQASVGVCRVNYFLI